MPRSRAGSLEVAALELVQGRPRGRLSEAALLSRLAKASAYTNHRHPDWALSTGVGVLL